MDFGSQTTFRVTTISWWAFLLPARARARLAGDGIIAARVEMPDGTRWRTERIPGKQRRLSWRRSKRLGKALPWWLRAVRAVPLVGPVLAWVVCEVDSWADLAIVAFALGWYERVEVYQEQETE